MSLLGKILLGINVLAAGGLAYLTAQDWAKRQEINGLALRYQMTLAGIPVDAAKADATDSDIPMPIETTPGNYTTTISKKLLDAHFGGPAPRSQADEVRTIKQKIDSEVAGMANDAAKLAYLCGGVNQQGQFTPGILMRFADTFEERQAVRNLALTRNPQQVTTNVTEARRRLDRKFEAVLSAPNPAAAQADATRIGELRAQVAANDPKAVEELATLEAAGSPPYTRDDVDRRNRIAQILMLHDPATANQKRTILIVGLRAYSRALNEQTGRVEEIIRRVERQMEQDQSKFQEEYELLKRLAREQDQILFQQQRVVAGLQGQIGSDNDAVELRQTQLTRLEEDLSNISRAVSDLLKAQASVEKSLFEVQRRVGDTLKGNFDLEDKLLKTEEGK